MGQKKLVERNFVSLILGIGILIDRYTDTKISNLFSFRFGSIECRIHIWMDNFSKRIVRFFLIKGHSKECLTINISQAKQKPVQKMDNKTINDLTSICSILAMPIASPQDNGRSR